MSQKNNLRLALLISGSGTTMEAIIKACKDKRLRGVEPVLVIASNVEAGGIERAKKLGIKKEDIVVIDPKDYNDSTVFGEQILHECKKRKVNFIGQYGWLHKTPKNVVDAYEGHILNQHPGPLDNGRPDFGGRGMYGIRVLKARLLFVEKTKHDKWNEATAHRVTNEFDKGKIVKRKQIPILEYDTAETLQMRTLPVEHEVQIEALHDFVNNTVVEWDRGEPLVEAGEESILEECRKLAIASYPNG